MNLKRIGGLLWLLRCLWLLSCVLATYKRHFIQTDIQTSTHLGSIRYRAIHMNQKLTLVINIATPSERNFTEKECEKVDYYPQIVTKKLTFRCIKSTIYLTELTDHPHDRNLMTKEDLSSKNHGGD